MSNQHYFVKQGCNMPFRVKRKAPSQDHELASCKYQEHAQLIVDALNAYKMKKKSTRPVSNV